MYIPLKFVCYIALVWLIISPVVASAKLLAPEQYPEGTCELAAKEFQKKYGGDLVFVQPLKPNGSFDLGSFKGYWLNKAWNKSIGTYYINYPQKLYFNSTQDIIGHYKTFENMDVVVYNVNKDVVPFGIRYYY